MLQIRSGRVEEQFMGINTKASQVWPVGEKVLKLVWEAGGAQPDG